MSTPFNQFQGGTGNLANPTNDFSGVSGFNAFSGNNPGFNGGFNPNFGNNSGINSNFGFNPYSGYNPLLGNPAGISGFSGSPFGSNALLNNPLSPNGFGAQNTFGSNALIQNPLSVSRGFPDNLGSNPLVGNPANATGPGQINNYTNNPGLFNPASNASFSNNPATIASGQPISGNGIPVNGGGVLPGVAGNIGGNNLGGGFGSSYATYGGSLLNSGVGTTFGTPYGATGFGSGFGGYPSLGIGFGGLTPYDATLVRAQRLALGASRYNLNTARASAAYAAANFYHDLASATASQSYRTSSGIRPSYSLETGSSRLTPAQQKKANADAFARLIPREKLLDENGGILWPRSAPTSPSELGEARKEVDSAVRVVSDEYAKDRRAVVRDVVTAQDKLRDYGARSLDYLRNDNPAEAEGVATFLASLDYALTVMGGGTNTASIGPDRTTPENAPKTGGEVLLESTKDARKDQPARQPEKSDAAPKSGGDVLREPAKTDAPSGPKS